MVCNSRSACDWLKVGSLMACLFTLFACSTEAMRPLNAEQVKGQQITTQGSASVSQLGLEQARQMAIEQAVNHAAAQLKRHNAGTSLISDVKVVDEWQDGDEYHVQALAVVSDKPACAAPQRKKIVATAFPIVTPDQISGTESQDLYSGIPREINNQLMESGDFLARNFTSTVLYARPDLAPEIQANSNYSGSSILNIARQHDAQFVLSGVIRDFKLESGEYVRGSGLLSEVKSMVRDMVGRRSIGVDIYVHDGLSGALIFQHRYNDSVMGDTSLPAGYMVGSERFSQTPVGYKIDNIIRSASSDIRQLLACYPYETRVQQVEAGKIIIAGGSQDKIKVGDRFIVHPSTISTVSNLAIPSATNGMLVITEVSANHAIGVLEGGNSGAVRAGDWLESAVLQ